MELMVASSTCVECGCGIDVVLDPEAEPVMPERCPNPACNEPEYQAEPDDCQFWNEMDEEEKAGLEPKHGSFAWQLVSDDYETVLGCGTGQI